MFEIGNRVKCLIGKNAGKIGFIYDMDYDKKEQIYVAFSDANGWYRHHQLEKVDNNKWE
jgi:hypothetical protein